MLGDWIFMAILAMIFIITIILSVIIINSAEDIGEKLRKTDPGMKKTYDKLKTGAYIALITSIVSLFFIFIAGVIILISPKNLDSIPRYVKIIIKMLYGLVASGLILYAGINMNTAAKALGNSRTYKTPVKSIKTELNESIAYIELAANLYYILAGFTIATFIIINVYDVTKSDSKTDTKTDKLKWVEDNKKIETSIESLTSSTLLESEDLI